MEFMLILSEDPELVATPEQRALAVQRVGEYAMGLVGDGVLNGGSPLHPVGEAKKVRTRDGRQRVLDGPSRRARKLSPGTSSSTRPISTPPSRSPPSVRTLSSARLRSARS